MFNNKIDAYDAARAAYLRLHPGSAESDWDKWLEKIEEASQNGTDDYDALAELCLDCVSPGAIDLDRSAVLRIAQAAGYFQARSAIVDEMAHDEGIQLVG